MILKKLTYLLFTFSLLFSTTALAKSSVWKVSKGNNELYIGGTIHLLPPSAYPLPQAFITAYENSDSIVLEAELPAPSDTAAQMKMINQMRYQNGKQISHFLSPNAKQKLQEYLKTLGMDLSQVAQFKPGFISVMMMAMELQKSQLAGEGVDSYFNKIANKDNKPIEYLESSDFQMSLISTMGEGNEDQFILTNISQMKDLKDIFADAIAAWRKGDSQKVNSLLIEPLAIEDPKSHKKLLIDRNNNWLPKIEKMLKDKNVEYVLVGVGHLVGKGNVIELLKNKGYKVTQLEH